MMFQHLTSHTPFSASEHVSCALLTFAPSGFGSTAPLELWLRWFGRKVQSQEEDPYVLMVYFPGYSGPKVYFDDEGRVIVPVFRSERPYI